MPKKKSDVFICRLDSGEYWAYPSPFIAHGTGVAIQFRNLTDDAIEIDFKNAPLLGKGALSLGPKAAGSVTVKAKACAGLYAYEARVTLAEVTPATRALSRAQPIFVQGGSPPRIVIDT